MAFFFLFQHHLLNSMAYKAQVLKALREDVYLTSSKFWSAYYHAQLQPTDLRELLPRLIPILLLDMAYEDGDESLLDDKDDESQPVQAHSGDYLFNVGNVRACNAKFIGILSNVYEYEVFVTLLPLAEVKLKRCDDETWKEREAIVFALGAIAKGCRRLLYPHLDEILKMLLHLLNDKFPLIRSISCWTISQYGKYFVIQKEDAALFNKVLNSLLHKLFDTNMRVQKFACLALITLEE
ncbi:hypothetical protein CARUB_v10016282mg, partial [Capsella rubella]